MAPEEQDESEDKFAAAESTKEIITAVSPKAVDEFLASRAPRRVTDAIKKRVSFLLYCGGNLVGCLAVTLIFGGGILLGFRAWDGLLSQIRIGFDRLQPALGVVIERSESGYGTGKRSTYRPIYMFRYTFTNETGNRFTGKCYGLHGPTTGEVAQVQYVRGKPSISRLHGCNVTPTGYLGVLGFGILASGAWFIVHSQRKLRRRVRLLSTGLVTTGRLDKAWCVEKVMPYLRIFRATVSYSFHGRQVTETVSITEREFNAIKDRAGSDQEIRLICDAVNQRRLFLVDTLLAQP